MKVGTARPRPALATTIALGSARVVANDAWIVTTAMMAMPLSASQPSFRPPLAVEVARCGVEVLAPRTSAPAGALVGVAIDDSSQIEVQLRAGDPGEDQRPAGRNLAVRGGAGLEASGVRLNPSQQPAD